MSSVSCLTLSSRLLYRAHWVSWVLLYFLHPNPVRCFTRRANITDDICLFIFLRYYLISAPCLVLWPGYYEVAEVGDALGSASRATAAHAPTGQGVLTTTLLQMIPKNISKAFNHKRRIKTEKKVKVVASVWNLLNSLAR